MRRQLAFDEWLIFSPAESKNVVLQKAAKLLAVTEDKLEWQWTGGGWLVRVRLDNGQLQPVKQS